MKSTSVIIAAETIEQAILMLRGQKVMLDTDLAALYGVSTGALNQAVRRNRARFPRDFMFQLTWDEAKLMRSQFVTASTSGKTKGTRIIVFVDYSHATQRR